MIERNLFKPEKKFAKENPQNVLTVSLPRIVYDRSNLEFRGIKKEVLMGMHTDMLGALFKVLEELKPTTRARLYLQGRVLNENQKRKLYGNSVFNFFWSGRMHRSSTYYQREVLTCILPKGIEATDEEIKKYVHMDFTPATLSQKLRYKVGWYCAQSVVDNPDFTLQGQNSLCAILGGCNQFNIGSDTMPSALLRMVQGRFVTKFREHSSSLVKDRVWLSDSVLAVTSRIIQI